MRIPSGSTDRYVYFVAVDATDLETREPGLSGFTVHRSRNGAAAAAMSGPTVTEVDGVNMPGVYALLVDEDTTIGATHDTEQLVLHVSHASMAPVAIAVELYRPKVAPEGKAVAGGPGEANGLPILGLNNAGIIIRSFDANPTVRIINSNLDQEGGGAVELMTNGPNSALRIVAGLGGPAVEIIGFDTPGVSIIGGGDGTNDSGVTIQGGSVNGAAVELIAGGTGDPVKLTPTASQSLSDAILIAGSITPTVAPNLDVPVSSVSGGTVDANVVSVAAGAITDAAFTVPPETLGRPAGFLGMMRRVYEWVANRRRRDRATGLVELFGADDTTVLERQIQSTSGEQLDNQTRGT